jgi:excisionase family DNA binding protein
MSPAPSRRPAGRHRSAADAAGAVPARDLRLLGVAEAAGMLGLTERAIRHRVARGVLPYRRLGARVLFVAAELEAFMSGLEGVTVAEALENIQARRSGAGLSSGGSR